MTHFVHYLEFILDSNFQFFMLQYHSGSKREIGHFMVDYINLLMDLQTMIEVLVGDNCTDITGVHSNICYLIKSTLRPDGNNPLQPSTKSIIAYSNWL